MPIYGILYYIPNVCDRGEYFVCVAGMRVYFPFIVYNFFLPDISAHFE